MFSNRSQDAKDRALNTLTLILSTLCLGAVFCFHFPEYLTTPELRAIYPVHLLRWVLLFFILLTLCLGIYCFVGSTQKRSSLWALTIVALSILLGGAWVETPEQVQQKNFLGLDWFILDLLIVGLLFIPIEKYFSDRPFKVFRKHWKTDFLHFLFNHLLIQTLSLMILWPSIGLAPLIAFEHLQIWIQAQPKWLQFIEIIFLADLTQYGIHRLFHQVPWMWRFHSIHHSSEQLDWLAGSRLHLFDIVLTRALTLFPLYLLGFSQGALEAYLVFVAFWATFLHVRFHHWHHASDQKAIDKNFAIHLPLFDRLFGSYYLPTKNQWPIEYGLSHERVSPTYWGQLVHPFVKSKKS